VINLRGAVIPVMDLHARFGLPPFAYNDRTCIVVVEVDHIKEGLIVDTVSEVLDMPLSNVESTPEMGRDPGTTLVEVIGKVGDEVRLILDIRRVLGIAPAPVRAAA
jgi:purine-binding chemotaxis protein CheW